MVVSKLYIFIRISIRYFTDTLQDTDLGIGKVNVLKTIWETDQQWGKNNFPSKNRNKTWSM